MSKYDAFGTILNMGTGLVQVETATIAGAITGDGNATVTITAAGMSGSPVALSVPVLNGDAVAVTAAKIAAFINDDASAAAIKGWFYATSSGADVILTRKIPMANDATLNIAYTNDTCTGLTPDATSADTQVGETLGPVAQVVNLSGPGLSLDTEDVTTHDSANAWEELVATIIRTGELSLDIVYDPAHADHDASTGFPGLLEARTVVGFNITFPDTAGTVWSFAAVVNGFEPGAAHDGALTAAVKLKLTGEPILA